MNSIETKIENFLTENFNYDYTTHDFYSFIYENLNYKFFIPSIIISDELYSPIMAVYEFDINYDIPNLEKRFENVILNFSKDDIFEINKYKSIANDIITISYNYNFACVESIFELSFRDYCSYEVTVEIYKLKDPFYTFPELKYLRLIQKYFKLSNNEAYKLIKEDIYDFATYHVGDTNNDGRDLFLEYFNDYLIPAILETKECIDKQKELEIIEEYKLDIDRIHSKMKVLEYCNIPEKDYDLSYVLSAMKESLKKELNNIPKKYRKGI